MINYPQNLLSLICKHMCPSNGTMHLSASWSQKSFLAFIFNYFLHNSQQKCIFLLIGRAQFILKEISPGCSLVGLMLKLKLQYFGHLMGRAYSFEKTLMLRNIEGGRRRGDRGNMIGWHHRLNGHEFEWIPRVGDGQGGLTCCSPWGHKELDTTEWLNWTELKWTSAWDFSLAFDHSSWYLIKSSNFQWKSKGYMDSVLLERKHMSCVDSKDISP